MATRKIPTPQDVSNKNPNDEKKDKVLDILVDALGKRKAGDTGKNPVFTDHVDPAVRKLVVADLEAQGWSVQIKTIYGGKLHWFITPAA